MKITPLDIQHQEFKTSLRGYDRAEVEAFLKAVSEAFEDLVKENAVLKERVETVEGQVGGLRQKENALQDLLVTTQMMAENLKQKAWGEADLILKEAETKAEDVVKRAQEEFRVLQHDILALQKQRIIALEKMRALINTFQKVVELEELDPNSFDPS